MSRSSYQTAGALLTMLLLAATPAGAIEFDLAAGKALFREQCLLCHSAEANDGGGAQGPSLGGIVGRPAATNPAFSYTDALRNSGLTWDAETLLRFLASPTTVVPGTSMVIAVPKESDRVNVLAYLYMASEQASADAEPASAHPAPTGKPDWLQDRPGRRHRIDASRLPAPFDTPSARNFPKLVPRPPDAKLSLPPGFHVDVFASGLSGPRRMVATANGDVLVTETAAGRISVLHPAADGSRSIGADVYAEHLKQPFGLALYPDAHDPQWLYVAETHRVIRYAWRTGDLKPRGEPEIVVPTLPAGGGHFTRDIAFSPDGKRFFVAVGSSSNVAETMPKKTPEELRAWQAGHAPGAAWGAEADRANVLVFDAIAPAGRQVYATGLRNCVSLTIQPQTGALWCTVNERDRLGDDLAPDYSTRVREGGFYGWPWYYIGPNEDPRLKDERPDLKGTVLVPDVLYQSHSASLNLLFYTESHGKSAFPSRYVGEGFAAFHGSWNRTFRTGHKVVRVRMKQGEPVGDYEDFLTGFITADGNAWGRPVALAELADGSLLLSDDGANLIYRISYAP